MARKGFKPTEDEYAGVELAQDESPEVAPEPIQEKPATATNPPAGKNELTSVQMACVAIAAFRASDIYQQINTSDSVQYRNGVKRLIVSISKLREKDAVGRASELLAVYKNFTEANVLDVKFFDNGKIVTVVSTDGDKYRYDLTTNTITQ